MNRRIFLVLILVIGCGLIRPAAINACGCAGTMSSATGFKAADLIFIGMVVQVDGSKWRSYKSADGLSGGLTMETGPFPITFEAIHIYRGRAGKQITMMGDISDCNVPFAKGETWLVYARLHNGSIVTDKCTRTRLKAEAEISQDLAYLDGLESGREQGVIFGEVFLRKEGVDGKPGRYPPFEPLQVFANGPSGRFQMTTNEWGSYQLVLPPGDFQVWVERNGFPVGKRQAIHVDRNSEEHLSLDVEFKD